MKKRFFGLISAFVMVLSLGAFLPERLIEANAETGDLYVCGIKLTSDNYKDILGNGKKEAVFDGVTKTLELNGDISNDGAVIYNELNGLTIKVNKDVTLTSDFGAAINCNSADTVITGKGKLTAISSENAGIYAEYCTLNIKDANIYAKGQWGIAGEPHNEILNIRTSTVIAEGDDGAICDFKNGIKTGDCYVNAPEKYQIIKTADSDAYAVCDKDGNKATKVQIDAPYQIWLGGKRITAENQDDILGDCTAYFDYKNKSIHLDGTTAIGEGGYGYYGFWNIDCEGLKLLIDDNSTITSYSGIYTAVDMTIEGRGKLTIEGEKQTVGIQVAEGAKLTINQADVYVKGTDFALMGSKGSSLTVKKSTLEAETGSDMYSAIYGFDSVDLIDDEYVTPAGAYYKSRDLYGGDNALAKSMKIAMPTRKKGDVVKNNKIDNADLLAVKSHIKKIKTLTGDDLWAADVDGNGAVNNTDLIAMKAHIKGVKKLW